MNFTQRTNVEGMYRIYMKILYLQHPMAFFRNRLAYQKHVRQEETMHLDLHE